MTDGTIHGGAQKVNQTEHIAAGAGRRSRHLALALAMLAACPLLAHAALAPAAPPPTGTRSVPPPVLSAAIRPALDGAKAVLKLFQPLSHTRINSAFGWRYNPVLRRSRQHKGVDYAAPAGTPILAAQDGTIAKIGRQRGDGLYIRIRHALGIETAYAHLSHFAPGLRCGSPVHRGEVIGAVGATGIATGPHLHYEVLVKGKQIDPQLQARDLPVQVAELR